MDGPDPSGAAEPGALQYAALRIADDLAARGFVEEIGPIRSMTQWWRWARHEPVA